MSDDERARAGTTGSGAVPPELEPFLRKRDWPKAQQLGEDPALDAAAAAYRARVESDPPAERPAPDLARGIGNASAYVAPVELPTRDPATATEDEPKIELAMAEVPRALPEGSPTRETVETRVLKPPRPEEDESTVQREPGGRTVGGRTQRLPAAKSPWAKDGGAPPVAPVELPSLHAPPAPSEPTSRPRSAAGHTGAKGAVLAGTLLMLVMLVLARVATTSTSGKESETKDSVASASPAASVTVSTGASAAPLPERDEMGSAATPQAAPTSAPTGTTPQPSGARHLPAKRGPLEDPYADAAVAPIVASMPTVAPPAPPVPQPPAPKPTAAPAPPAANDGELFKRPKPRDP